MSTSNGPTPSTGPLASSHTTQTRAAARVVASIALYFATLSLNWADTTNDKSTDRELRAKHTEQPNSSNDTISLNGEFTVIAKAGDSISRLALQHLGYHDNHIIATIVSDSNLRDANRLAVGDVVVINRTKLGPYVAEHVGTQAMLQVVFSEQKMAVEPEERPQPDSSDKNREYEIARQPSHSEHGQLEEPAAPPSRTTANVAQTSAKPPDPAPRRATSSDPLARTDRTSSTPVTSSEDKPLAESKSQAQVAPPAVQASPGAPSDSAGAPPQSEPSPKPADRPGLFEVDETVAARALERSLVQSDALLLKPGRAELVLEAFHSQATERTSNLQALNLDSEPPETANPAEPIVVLSNAENRQFLHQTALSFRLGLPADSQVEFYVPYVVTTLQRDLLIGDALQPRQSESLSGAGDVRLGFLKTLARERGSRPDLIGRLAYTTNSGDESHGIAFGAGTEQWIAGLAATKRQDPLVFTLSLSHTMPQPTDTTVPGDISQLSIGAFLAASPATSLKFQFDYQYRARDEGVAGVIRESEQSGLFEFGASSVVGAHWMISASLTFDLGNARSGYAAGLSVARRFTAWP